MKLGLTWDFSGQYSLWFHSFWDTMCQGFWDTSVRRFPWI
jgi:hypothetical protein